jgi:kumamolisin
MLRDATSAGRNQCNRAQLLMRSALVLRPWRTRSSLALSALLLLGSPMGLCAAASPLPLVLIPGSIKKIPAAAAAFNQARVVRNNLTADEEAAPMQVEVALKMRNFTELQARVARGEIISREEMAGKYFPLAADYEATADWLTAQGLEVTCDNTMRLSLFARGTVRQIKQAFQVNFARVVSEGVEYSSAITDPSLPATLTPSLLGVNGLQPHIRAHKFAYKDSLTTPYARPYLPSEILHAYNADITSLTGAGQTIAIVIDVFPISTDLATFWSQCGINRSLGSIAEIPVGNTTPPSSSSSGYDGTEATIDTEITSSLAPAAQIRIYAGGSLETSVTNLAYQQIYNDLPSLPGMRVVSISFGTAENQMPTSAWQTTDQYFASLASSGVTICVASGDSGSNPDYTSVSYNSANPTQPVYPASDPFVTGVGGTSLTLGVNGTVTSEVGWSLNGGTVASGGGISSLFACPAWQVGTGIPTNPSGRLVPDVASNGDPNTGFYIYYEGQGSEDAGTSASAPTWAAFCTLLNQVRATLGLAPLGLLGPKVYPLLGTKSFRDITSGNNGAYNAGPGYDLVTGIGVPVVSSLVSALGTGSPPPTITAQPASVTIAPGNNATFSVTVSANPAPTYQWSVLQPGSSWSYLSDNSTYSGSTTATLTVNAVTPAMSGNLYMCLISNINGPVLSAPAALVVATPLWLETFAGEAGNNGSTDGTGNAVRFKAPGDVATDYTGNIYVVDTDNHTIRKITPNGTVTTLAGLAGVSGSTDGLGSAARFNNPSGIVVDIYENIFVADTDNHTIRAITQAGNVTTVAGLAGSSGSADGAGSSARFNHPSGIAVDAEDNLYVADTGNNTIRMITSGTVTTLAGTAGTIGSTDGAEGLFSSPEGIAVTFGGGVYVADTNNHTIRSISTIPAVTTTTLAGLAQNSGSSDGPGTMARFQYPAGIAVDEAGNVYVADTDNHTVRLISSTGVVGTIAGLAGSSGSTDGLGTAARLFYPTGIAVDESGNVYVADTSNDTIRKGQLPTVPLILTEPQAQIVTAGATVTFSVTANGAPPPTYQWFKAGQPINGATSAILTLSNVQASDAATYTVVVTNFQGSVTSSPAFLVVNAPIPAMTTASSSTGGSSSRGGGGGAPSWWFYGALSLLVAIRQWKIRARQLG